MKPTAIILDIENLSENLKNSDLFEDVSIRRDHITNAFKLICDGQRTEYALFIRYPDQQIFFIYQYNHTGQSTIITDCHESELPNNLALRWSNPWIWNPYE